MTSSSTSNSSRTRRSGSSRSSASQAPRSMPVMAVLDCTPADRPRPRWENPPSVHETPDDLTALQTLLDESFARAGPHLLSIVRPERRLTATQLSERLQGMCLLAVATVTADGRPIIGAVDGVFYRGAFHLGSSDDSVRFAHLRARPQVSATHLPSEALQVTVHGRAQRLDVR